MMRDAADREQAPRQGDVAARRGRRPGAGADFVIEAVGLDHVKPKLESGPDPTGILPMQQGYQICALGGHYITTGLPRGNIALPGSLFAIGGVSHHGGQAGGASPMRDIPRFVELMEKRQLPDRADGHHSRPARRDARGLRAGCLSHDHHGVDAGIVTATCSRPRETVASLDLLVVTFDRTLFGDILQSPHGGPMRLFTRLVFVVVLVSLAVVSSASQVAAQRQVMTTITRLYTGVDGQSHAEDTEGRMAAGKVAPGAQRVGIGKSHRRAVPALATRLRVGGPPGVETPVRDHRQRTREVDAVGGKKVQLAPGRVLLAEDVTGKGHTTRVGGRRDLVMLLVPLAQEP